MSNISLEQLKEHCSQIGLVQGFIDLDETIIQTEATFTAGITLARAVIASLTNLDQQAIEDDIRDASRRGLKIENIAVHPDRWKNYVLPELEKRYDLEEGVLINTVLKYFEEVYTALPQLIEGAAEVLPLINQAVPLTIVSHAESAYTERKWRSAGIDQWNIGYIATDPHLPYKDWPYALSKSQISDPSRVVVIGDSVESDAWQSHHAGIGWRIWFDRKGLSKTDIVPALPPNTQTITSLRDLPEAIMSLS